jgi:hypothetical protein
VPHPPLDLSDGSHGPGLVKLPSRRVLSNQANVSEGGDGRCCTDHHGAQRICTRSRWRLRKGSRPRSSNTWLPWARRYQVSGLRPCNIIFVYFLGPVSPMSARPYSLSFCGSFDGQLASSGLCDPGRSGWSELDADRARPYRSRDCRNMVVG